VELIIAAIPIVFFLFSVFEAQKTSNVIGYGNSVGRLPKNWVRVEPCRGKADEDCLNRLDYLSETVFDLERSKNRARYEYCNGL